MRTLLVVAVLVCMTGVARAQVEPSVYSEFSVEARHVGLLVHLDVGVDYLHSAASQNGTRLTLSGPGASASLVIGGSVAENWFLGADLWGSSAFTPTAGIATILPQISGDQTLGLYGLGFNVTHYIMPGNLYFSFSPSVTVLSLDNPSQKTSASTNLGFGGRLVIGREWLVARHIGLGVAAEAMVGVNPDKSGGPTWTTWGCAVVFSATFN